ncbi:MAG: right-handed parallel beta-helix repeat-containing protein [Planctomycetota bacterium]
MTPLAALRAQTPVGAEGAVGPRANPTTVNRLWITQGGIYENFIVDGGGANGNLVKISADNVTVRNCEIRNGSGNGIGIFGNKVVIENCRIHHMLASTFHQQHDAHGISGRWGDTVIRNCDIAYVSGDCIQFDPDRVSNGVALIERCTLWTGPLPADAAGFKAGQRPGENAVDTKTKPDGRRSKLVIRHCFMHGWNQPAQISVMAALNLKENVDAEVTNCVFFDNEVAFRVRGPGQRGGAHVTITDCAIYDTATGVRAEDEIEILRISGLAFGEGVKERIRFVNGKATAGYQNTGERTAPALDALLKGGL